MDDFEFLGQIWEIAQCHAIFLALITLRVFAESWIEAEIRWVEIDGARWRWKELGEGGWWWIELGGGGCMV